MRVTTTSISAERVLLRTPLDKCDLFAFYGA
jgi:hypothetical protein